MPSGAKGTQSYTKWERLGDALTRVMGAGIPEDEAKQAICDGIADGTVEIRLTVREHKTKPITAPDKVLTRDDVDIPPHIQFHEMDFETSRPFRPWSVKRERISYLGGYWDIEWIEISRADITKLMLPAPTSDQSVSPPLEDLATPTARLGRFDSKTLKRSEAARSARRRGRRPIALPQTIEAIRKAIQERKMSLEQLHAMREKKMASDYGVSRDTARKARNSVLSEFNFRQIPTNDK
jgi:hypothetical protein